MLGGRVRGETSGKRHPGHSDGLATREQFYTLLREERYGILDVGGALVQVDSTDFAPLDYDRVLAAVCGSME